MIPCMPFPVCSLCFSKDVKARSNVIDNVTYPMLLCDSCWESEQKRLSEITQSQNEPKLTRKQWARLDDLEDESYHLQGLLSGIESKEISLEICEKTPNPAGRAEYTRTTISSSCGDAKTLIEAKLKVIKQEIAQIYGAH